MLTTPLIHLYQRDLEQLQKEIESYQDEKNLWKTEGGITNSAGNLALHLIGNLNAFIGTNLGETGYVRQRDLEFSLKDVPRRELIQQLEATSEMIENVLSHLSKEELAGEYPIQLFGKPMRNDQMLLHLYGHLNYHLGQLNYHRRLLDH